MKQINKFINEFIKKCGMKLQYLKILIIINGSKIMFGSIMIDTSL